MHPSDGNRKAKAGLMLLEGVAKLAKFGAWLARANTTAKIKQAQAEPSRLQGQHAEGTKKILTGTKNEPDRQECMQTLFTQRQTAHLAHFEPQAEDPGRTRQTDLASAIEPKTAAS